MLHLFYGSDEYSITQAGTRLVMELLGAESSSASRVDPATTPWPALREACFTMSMFAPARLIVVRGLIAGWSGRGDGGDEKGSAKKPKASEFAAFVAQMPEATHLVLLEGALPQTNRYLKELQSSGGAAAEVRAFDSIDPRAVPRWLDTAVRERGATIDADAADELAARCGADLRLLSTEIDKLLMHCAPATRIQLGAVKDLVYAPDRVTSFTLIDSVCTKQPPRAIELAQRLLELGEAPEAILGLLGSRIRDLTILDSARREGVAEQTVIKDLGWNPGRLYHLQKARSEFTTAQLLDAQLALVTADAALKSRSEHERPSILLLTVLAIASRKGTVELEAALVN